MSGEAAPQSHSPSPPVARRTGPVGDRRGVVASLFAVSGAALVGMVALAAEAGVWQLQLRTSQTAADLAALSAASAIERSLDIVAVARDTASRNGFTSGSDGGRTTVTIARPPTSGAFAGNSDAVEIVVSQTQTLGMARLVLGAPPVVRSRAVAVNTVDVDACILALGGGLSLGGNSTTNARRCALAANSTQYGINVFGSARVRASDLITTGNCTGCTSGDVWTDDTRTARPAISANRPNPIRDPFEPLQRWRPSPPNCPAAPVQFTRRTATISASDGAICNNLSVGPNETLNLNPGIYFFNDASLDIRGTVNTGSGGVTIVLTGNADDGRHDRDQRPVLGQPLGARDLAHARCSGRAGRRALPRRGRRRTTDRRTSRG